MKKFTFLLILALAFAIAVPCYAVDTNEYNDFIRVVIDGKMVKQKISPFASIGTDVDRINAVIKNNVTTGTFTGDNTAGVVLKGYYQSGVSIAGNSEINGASIFLLNDATQAGASKSSVLSCRVHSDSSTTVDRGISLFGDTTNAFMLSGDHTNLIECKAGTEGGFTTSSLKNSDSGDIKCDGYFVLDVAGTAYYIPVYNTLN